MNLRSGDRVGDYMVQSPIGTGGFGAVYRVERATTGEMKALKVLHHELLTARNAVERFEREIEAISRIRHPNVIDIESAGRLPDGRPYFVMELLSGMSLEAHLRSKRRLSSDAVLAILEPLCGALAAAHARDIVHRDLKASNVFLSESAGQLRVVLLDFGIAKLLDADAQGLTTPSSIVGTASCMAPEQVRGEPATVRTDVYAVGVLAFLMITGQPVFDDPSFLLMQSMHLFVSPAKPSAIAPITSAFDDVILRALSKAADKRFPDAMSFFEAFREAASRAGGRPSVAREHRALALHVEVRADDAALDAPDDALFTDMEAILPFSSTFLCALGFEVVLRTGNTALLGLVLPDDAGEERCNRRAAVSDAIALHGALSRRATLDPRVKVTLCVHVGRVPPLAASLIDGDLLNVSAWVPSESVEGILGTPEALDGLGFATSPAGVSLNLLLITPGASAGKPH